MTALRAVLLSVSVLVTISCSRKEAPPEFGQVPDFHLTDQNGREVTPQSWRGKPWVAAFMFTRCPTVCPKITQAMKSLQERAKEQGIALNWVSFSVDPENDTPEVLRAYAKEYALNLDNWSFLTGDISVVRQTAEAGFKISVDGTLDENSPHYGISHGSHLVLVGPQGKIRGYFRTLEPKMQQKLLDTAKLL